MSIPKIIHQIWLGPNKRPKIWMDSWEFDYIKQNPDWKYKLWTEKEINELKLINRDKYDREPTYPGKSDIARYEILNQFGGVFIDADSLWIDKPNNSLNIILNKLNNNIDMFCAVEPVNKWSYANGVIGFSKNNDLLKIIIEFIKKNYDSRKKKFPAPRQLWQVTGPGIFTSLTKNYNDNKKMVLESFYFYPTSFHKNNLDKNTKEFPKLYPNSIMFQYGYSTNNILNDNCMKKFIDSK